MYFYLSKIFEYLLLKWRILVLLLPLKSEGMSCRYWLTITGAIFCRSISQEALCSAPHSGVAGLHRSGSSREEGVWESGWWVWVNRLGQDRGLRSVRLVVQAPRDAQVASVLVHTAHVPPASIWQGTALIHIWNTERCTDKNIPASRTSVSAWFILTLSLETYSVSHFSVVFSFSPDKKMAVQNVTFHIIRRWKSCHLPIHCLALRSYAKPSVQTCGEMTRRECFPFYNKPIHTVWLSEKMQQYN